MLKPGGKVEYWRQPLRLSVAQRARYADLWQIEEMLSLGGKGREFEQYVGFLFERAGYRVLTTPATGDNGVDLILVRDKTRYVVQCKQYKLPNKVPEGVIRELPGVALHENAHRAILVTTSRVTEQGHRWATNKPIRLIEGAELSHWARRLNRADAPQPFVERLSHLGMFFYHSHRRVFLAGFGLLLGLLLIVAVAAAWPSDAKSRAATTLPSGQAQAVSLPATSLALTTPVPPPSSATPAPPTVAPPPAPRAKDAVSAPCYVGQIKGFTKSHFYHLPGWPYYNSFGSVNPLVVCFDSREAAEAAGFRPGQQPKPAR